MKVGFARATAAGIIVISCARSAAAQTAPTCGWHFLEVRDVPPTLASLAGRTGNTRAQEAVKNLVKWYHECNSASGHEAIRLLRGSADRGSDTIKALLGVSLLRSPDVQIERAEGVVIRPQYRSNMEDEGVRLLMDVLERVTWPEVAAELASVEVTSRDESDRDRVAALLTKRAPAINGAGVWSGLAELDLSRGKLDAARRAAQQAIALGSARGERVSGILQMLTDNDPTAGAATYLRGLRDDGDALHAYFDDIRLLLGPDELTEWEALATSRATWIHEKWDWRAQLAGIRIGERLAENQRRLRTARERYPRATYRGAPLVEQIWLNTALTLHPFDDRGLIYLRFGEPTEVLRMRPDRPDPGRMPQRIAWIYTRVGAIPSVYEFDVSPDRPGFFLAQPLQVPQCIKGSSSMPGARASEPPIYMPEDHSTHPIPGDVEDWSTSVFMWDHSLGLYYNSCALHRYTEMLLASRRRAAEALRTENAVRPYAAPLAASMNLYAFRGANGRPELISYLSIDGGRLRADSTSSLRSYAVGVLFSAGNPISLSVQRTDTTLAFTLREKPASGSFIGSAIRLATVPGDETRISVSLRNRNDEKQGQVMVTTKAVPAFAAGALALSDIVIAQARNGTWVRGQHRLAPWSGHAVPLGTPFRVYYEMYGAQTGDAVHVRMTVAPSRDASILGRLKELISKGQALSLEYDDTYTPDADGVARVMRDIGTELEAGAYVVDIEITNTRSGQTAVAQTNLVLVKAPVSRPTR
jgi:hypothetical protein